MTLHLSHTIVTAIWELLDEFFEVDFDDRIKYLEAEENLEFYDDLAQRLQHARSVVEEWRNEGCPRCKTVEPSDPADTCALPL
jgi:hypothetical protein